MQTTALAIALPPVSLQTRAHVCATLRTKYGAVVPVGACFPRSPSLLPEFAIDTYGAELLSTTIPLCSHQTPVRIKEAILGVSESGN